MAKSLVLIALTLGLFTARPALAYLDAGSGSMLLQLVLGGVAGLVVILKLYWRRLLTLIGIHKEYPEQNPDDTPAERG